jgi:hypothetical protein
LGHATAHRGERIKTRADEKPPLFSFSLKGQKNKKKFKVFHKKRLTTYTYKCIIIYRIKKGTAGAER